MRIEGKKLNRIILAGGFLMLLVLYAYRGYSAALIAMIFVAVYVAAAFIYVRLLGSRLEVELTGGDMVGKNEEIPLQINIRNKSVMPIFCCVCLCAENRLTDTSEYREIRMVLPPGRKTERSVTISDEYCGRITVRIDKIDIEDPLRILAAEHVTKEVDGEGGKKSIDSLKRNCYVAPLIGTMTIPSDWLDSYDMESYRYSQYEKGNDPGEVFGVREYIEGDSPKQIHWKLTAKLGEMTVKIPSLPVENNILVILDNLLEEGTRLEADRRSRMIEDYCSLSMSLAEKDIAHSIGWYDIDHGSFRYRSIRRAEDLTGVIPEILGCGFAESDHSAVQRYIEDAGRESYTNYFMVTGQSGRDIDRLENQGAVRMFRTE